MVLRIQKKKTDRVATDKQMISVDENFFIFRLKGLASQTNGLRYSFRAKGRCSNQEELSKCMNLLREAQMLIERAEIHFKKYQLQRIKEGAKQNADLS